MSTVSTMLVPAVELDVTEEEGVGSVPGGSAGGAEGAFGSPLSRPFPPPPFQGAGA